MIKKIKILIAVLAILLSSFLLIKVASAQSCGNKEECQSLIEQYEKKLTETRSQKNTLSSQISLMDTQINLTTVQIKDTEYAIVKTEDEILNLTDKIEGLDTSLDFLGKILLKKVVQGYKHHEVPFFNVFLDSDNATTLARRYKYLKTAEESDRKLAFQVQQAKQNFEQQKNLREEKKVELGRLQGALSAKKIELDNQKAAKQRLLATTQSDERVYQNLLSKLRAEFAAIQGIVAGAGTETRLRDVRQGETIASIIPGASCNSSGGHLHFIVKDGGNVANPFNYLKSVSANNCSGSSCGSADGDPFNPSGSWDWPINPTIQMYQGYGETWAVRNTWVGSIYRFHNGIDILGSGYSVYAVADGALYRGSFGVGCSLPYMKIEHADGKSSYYLHVVSS